MLHLKFSFSFIFLSGGHRIFVPPQCSLNSKRINIAGIHRYHMKDREILRNEEQFLNFKIDETRIFGSSLELQQRVAKQMGMFGEIFDYVLYIQCFRSNKQL